MKKVLHIFSRISTGGAERLVLEFARRADTDRYTVSVAAAREGIVRNIFDFVKREKPEIVHTHLLSGDCVGYFVKLLHPNIRWISTQHNVEAFAPIYKRIIWKRILRKADAVVAVSAAVEEWCIHGFDIHQEKIRRMANAIPTETFLDIPPFSKITSSVWRLASIGRLEKQKGHDILIAALAELNDLPWTCSLYGDGSWKRLLLKLSRSRHIGQQVFFCGIVPAITALRGAQIVVQPSRWEGRSLAVMEAMAAGRCVVASAVAGVELIEHGKTGVIVPMEDVHALGVALRRLMAHPVEVARLGANAREYAREHFGFDAWMKAMDELYQSV